jgi:hypothetical protein
MFGAVIRGVLRRPGLGCLPDPKDLRDLDIDRLGLGRPRSTEHTLRPLAGAVLDQGPTNTCVSQALLDAEGTCMRAVHGESVPIGSRLANYYLARVQHGGQRYDLGTYLRAGVKALSKWGIVEEARWPFRLAKLNAQPPISVLVPSRKRRGIRGYYRIFDSEPLGAIQAAVASGRPVAFGMKITDAFTEPRGPDHIEYPLLGRMLGGHAMQCVGYAPGYLLIKNSWGAGWRDGGYAWLSEAHTTAWHDIWVVDPGPPGS